MSRHSQILIHHLSYAVAADKPVFKGLTLSLAGQKIGLVGRNGVGKSTLLKLIMGEFLPQAGTIHVHGKLGYCPQQIDLEPSATIVDVLDFENSLHDFGLTHLTFDRTVQSLSGGEQTRLMLAKVFLSEPDFVLLDEPTNNLDINARTALYRTISHWKKGLLVVSHDRALLNLMDQIVELTTLSVNVYGGNYVHFVAQKELVNSANQRLLLDAQKDFKKTKSTVQTNQEKSEQKKSYGRKQFLAGKVDKLTANSRRGRSEKTQSRHAKLHEALIKNSESQLQEAKAKIEITDEIHINLPKTAVPNGKMVVDLEDLTFSYPDQNQSIINHFNLKLVGPKRLAITGPNGAGKSTLVKLILQELIPTAGKIQLGIEHVSYLDQQVSLLNPELSVLDNFKHLNPNIHETDARFLLAQFLFKNVTALKLVKNLSGGEKLRAGLACTLGSEHPPQLLILDEPTNHLDLQSITSVETALKCYLGALIVISHDQKFLENIGIETAIAAPLIFI